MLKQCSPGVFRSRREPLPQFFLPDKQERFDHDIEVLRDEASIVCVIDSDGDQIRGDVGRETLNIVDDVVYRVAETSRLLLEGCVRYQVVTPSSGEVERLLNARILFEDAQKHLLSEGGASLLKLSPRFSDELLLFQIEYVLLRLVLLLLVQIE